jgi:hypothetical protein
MSVRTTLLARMGVHERTLGAEFSFRKGVAD